MVQKNRQKGNPWDSISNSTRLQNTYLFIIIHLLILLPVDPLAADSSNPSESTEQTTLDTLIGEGVAHYSDRRYDEAIECFKRALDIQREPELLYNIARSYERLTKSEEALEWYEKFLEEPGSTGELRMKALTNIAALRQEINAKKAAEASGDAEASTDVAKTPASAEKTESPQSDYDDSSSSMDSSLPPPAFEESPRSSRPLRIVGWITTGVGAAGVIAGSIFGGLALKAKKDFDDAGFKADRVGYRDDMKRNALVFDIVFSTGAVLTVTGVTLLLVDMFKQRSLRESSDGRTKMRLLPSLVVSNDTVAAGLRCRF